MNLNFQKSPNLIELVYGNEPTDTSEDVRKKICFQDIVKFENTKESVCNILTTFVQLEHSFF